jgi:MtfA peptidase
MLLITEMRRRRLKSQPFPPAWEKVLEGNVSLYRRLPAPDREELKGHIQVFLAEKNFEGCGGQELTDEVRLTVAGQACILLLHRETDYYPGLSSILVYPGEYLAPQMELGEDGVVTEGTDRRSGESWQEGSLVLSWEDVLAEGLEVHEAYNVVLHEFAHQLDAEDGITAAALLPKRARFWELAEVLEREYLRLQHDTAHRRTTLLDPYGAESPEEFFAVATECFFEQPVPLRQRHPELYAGLARYFRQDPAEWREESPPP